MVNVGNIWEIIIKILGQRWVLFYFNYSQRWPANEIASHHSQLGQRWELTPVAQCVNLRKLLQLQFFSWNQIWKTAILDIFRASEFWFWWSWTFSWGLKLTKIKNLGKKLPKMAAFETLKKLKIISRKIWVDNLLLRLYRF